ncbi:hypothetical protein SFRURICE_005730 [Spodoptera frugiperda]|nr:hypothetical protein SFRURICE_005730 [Spodoptera frugiperda]
MKLTKVPKGRGFDHFDPRLLSIKLGVELSLNGLEVSPLSHCINSFEGRDNVERRAGRMSG